MLQSGAVAKLRERVASLSVVPLPVAGKVLLPSLLLATAALLGDLGIPEPGLAQALPLQYQNRGDRYEGIKPKPVDLVGGLELISALASDGEGTSEMPERLRLTFYLPRPAAVFLTVRELEYVHYYWMDRVQRATPWTPRFANVFEWPTRDVVKRLDGLKMHHLGAVVRLDNGNPSAAERVAPAILHGPRDPKSFREYVFTFRGAADATVTASVYQGDGAPPRFVSVIKQQPGRRPFPLVWDASTAGAGDYTLTLRGHFLDTNKTIDHVVHFHHPPRLR